METIERRELGRTGLMVSTICVGTGPPASMPARTSYGYRTAEGPLLDRIRAIDATCNRHGVPLAAAALQFSMRDPRVTSTVIGVWTPERIAERVALATKKIPAELSDELEAERNPAAPEGRP